MSQAKRQQKQSKREIKSNILRHGCSPRCIILIITTARMMILQALLKVQLVFLYTQVDGVYLLLHGGHSHLHSAHPP
jgi:hypothetical protein